MNKEMIIKQTAEYVKNSLEGETTGHDWWHIERVWKMALRIAKEEKGADLFVVQMASLLHDIADWKFHKGDEYLSSQLAREWLEKFSIEKNTIDRICDIIDNVTFKGALHKTKMKSVEGMIVQDADRLDALGAVGIARVFAFGGHRGNPIHDPNQKPNVNQTVEEYKEMKATAINHFYEKLFLLKYLLHTKTAKKIAEKRHKFMEKYLEEFFKEWNGKD